MHVRYEWRKKYQIEQLFIPQRDRSRRHARVIPVHWTYPLEAAARGDDKEEEGHRLFQ